MAMSRAERLGTSVRGRGVRLPRQSLFFIAVVAVVVFLVLVPLVVMIYYSLRTAGPAEATATFTLANYARAYLNPATYRLLGNTVLFSAGSLALGTAIGTGFAWLVERTNVPLRGLAYVLVPLSGATPGVLFAISWVLILSPRIGLLNLPFVRGLGWETGPINPFTLTGMIFVEGIRVSSSVFLMMVGLFRSMDSSLEEAATMSGAGTATVLRRVTLPMMAPGLFGVVIFTATYLIGSFEVPAIMGLPGGIEVFSTRVFLATRRTPRDYGMAGSLSTLFVIFGLVGILLYHRALRKQERFATVTGKGYRPGIVDLGRKKALRTAAILLYAAVAIGLPLFILVWASFTPFYQPPSLAALGSLSIRSYTTLLELPYMFSAVKNTVALLIIVPTATMVLSTVVSWIVVRTSVKGRKSLDFLAFVPHAMPSIVIGLAFMLFFLTFTAIPIYGTVWVIALGLITSYIAFGSRTMNGAMFQLHHELEEAAHVHGASLFTAFRRVVVPLLIPSVIGGWIWIAMHSVRELSIALMLSSASSRPVSVLIWDFWQVGEVPRTAAMGVLLTGFVVLLLVLGRRLTSSKDEASLRS